MTHTVVSYMMQLLKLLLLLESKKSEEKNHMNTKRKGLTIAIDLTLMRDLLPLT